MKTILSLVLFLVCTSLFCTKLVYSQSVYSLKQIEKTENQGRTDPGDGDPCPGQPTITDSDGNVYNTVLIGGQCWMAENLNIGNRIDGSSSQTDNGIIEKYCYNNSDAQCDVYGGLYQWDEMMGYTATEGSQGICPDGWHLPTDAEWTALATYLGGESVAGGSMKESGTIHWSNPNTGATNSSGFTGLPGGYRLTGGSFDGVSYYGYWWTSSKYSTGWAWYRILYYETAQVYRYNDPKGYGYSVRCVRDESVVIIPNETTIQDLAVVQDQDTCFNAINGITVSDFVVHPGGSATFIAGGNIIFLHGTVVMQEGHLHAYITTNSNYCTQPAAMLAVNKPAEIFENQAEEQTDKKCFFKVYPNPTTGDFTLQLHGFEEPETVLVQILSMQGKLLSAQELPALSRYNISLKDRQPGIYLIRLVMNGQTGVAKVVKK